MTDSIIALSDSGVTVLLEVSGGELPAVAYWGPALDTLDTDDAVALVAAGRPVPGRSEVDEPARVSLLPEAWTGWTGRPGLVGSREGRNWSTRFTVTSVLVNGAPAGDFTATGPAVVEVAATDAEAQLALTITVELLAGGALRSRADVRNLGGDDFALDGLTLAYPVPAQAGELLDLAGRWGRERVPQRLPLRVGTHVRENRRGRTGPDSAYVLHAGVPGFGFGHGDVHAVHIAWSGNHLHYAERTFTGTRLLGGGELLLPGEVRLGTGEAYRSPWLYGSFGYGLDEVARRFHAVLRHRSRPVQAERPVTLNVWEAVYFDHDLDRLRTLAERAAAVGVERFVLDDGWFGARRSDTAGLGDWVVSPDVWPEGLHPLVDRVHELGMQFGLWVEPEMVNVDSDVARAHPEWIMAARGELPKSARNQQVLDLAVPGAYEHVKGQLLALLDEYDIGYLKWDHNRDLVEPGDCTDAGRPAVHRQTLATYRLLDELRQAHPDLEIESCASGGARVDLGVLERTDRVWVSDCIDALERQYMQRWTSQLIPPEYQGAHIGAERAHTTGRRHDLSFRAGTAVFGHLGIEWDLTRTTDEERAELAAWVTFFKANRDLLMSGDVVRMDGPDDAVSVHGVVAADRSRALFAMAVLGAQDDSQAHRLRLRGLDPTARYRIAPVQIGTTPSGLEPPVWWGDGPDFAGCVLTGAALEHAGVAPPPLHPEQVVLFDVRRE